jgi:ATP synthase protein I
MWRTAGTTGAVGIEVALSVLIGYLGGNYLDKKLETTPWLTYFGLAAGIGAAIKGLARVVRKYRRDFGDKK